MHRPKIGWVDPNPNSNPNPNPNPNLNPSQAHRSKIGLFEPNPNPNPTSNPNPNPNNPNSNPFQVHRSKIGWVEPLFTCNGYECIGVGDDKHSWSWCPQPDDVRREGCEPPARKPSAGPAPPQPSIREFTGLSNSLLR